MNPNIGKYNLDEMTEQQAFDAVVNHLLTQNRASISSDNTDMCLYDGGECCCAAAIFIQDYTPKMEGNSWQEMVKNFDQSSNHQDLISDMQNIHDWEDPTYWEGELRHYAGQHELQWNFGKEAA